MTAAESCGACRSGSINYTFTSRTMPFVVPPIHSPRCLHTSPTIGTPHVGAHTPMVTASVSDQKSSFASRSATRRPSCGPMTASLDSRRWTKMRFSCSFGTSAHRRACLPATVGILMLVQSVSVSASQLSSDPDTRRASFVRAAQVSSIIVVGRMESPAGALSRISVEDCVKGPSAPGDTVSYHAGHFDREPGARVLLFLRPRPSDDALSKASAGAIGYFESDSLVRFLGLPTLPWADLRDEILQILSESDPRTLLATDTIAVYGTVIDGSFRADGSLFHQERILFGLHVTQASPPHGHLVGDTIRVHYPFGLLKTARHWKFLAPPLRVGQAALFFLDRDGNSEYYLHGGLYSVWRHSNGVFSAVYQEGTSDPVQTVASAPADSVWPAFQEVQ